MVTAKKCEPEKLLLLRLCSIILKGKGSPSAPFPDMDKRSAYDSACPASDRWNPTRRAERETRLGENVFEVSMHIDPPSTVRDVLDVVGNPDLLRLWCDPIRALFVTKSSEGARSATNRGEEGGDREVSEPSSISLSA